MVVPGCRGVPGTVEGVVILTQQRVGDSFGRHQVMTEYDITRSESFGRTLDYFIRRAGISQNALAKIVGISASYVNRLCSGEREAPTREVAHALARAMKLAPEEVDRLLFSAGHVPPSLQKLGPADSTVAAVTRLLTNDKISPEARADFRAIVETIAIRWQCNFSIDYISPNRSILPKEKKHTNHPGQNGYVASDELVLAAVGRNNGL
jgi:transcriptional regulator with XRE-family HTH domain